MMKPFHFLILVLAVLSIGCVSRTEPTYKDLLSPLDDQTVLEISTYPAWFGSTSTSVPYLYRKRQAHNHVYLQLMVRGRKNKMGGNPQIKSILIDHFSYQLDDHPKQLALKNYPKTYWMQNNSNYDTTNLAPIPFHEGSKLKIEVEITLNGKKHFIEGTMSATKNHQVYPLPLEMLR